jgi:hypothetical protein
MPQRLFDDDESPPGEERLALSGVPPLSADEGTCALVVCLRAALTAVGEQASYGRLMGLLGPAFMLRMEAGFSAELAVTDRWRHVGEALAALGWPQSRLTRPTSEEALRIVQAELATGRPVLMKGWGDQPLDWAIIVGRQGRDLLGRWPGSGRGLRRAGPDAELALMLGEPGQAADEEWAVAAALVRAVPLLGESVRAYATWQELMDSEAPYGPPLQQRDRLAAEQWLVQCLVDARWAAEEFLREGAGLFGEIVEETLLEDADLLGALAGDLEQLLVPLDAPVVAQLVDDPEWRGARRQMVARAADTEERLRSSLQRLLDECDVQHYSQT